MPAGLFYGVRFYKKHVIARNEAISAKAEPVANHNVMTPQKLLRTSQ